ncbi:hypothetical protein HZH66_013379 [Vespula vulgaris]|uniref:Uncharacterized protein n=1 Tax=Vespula vulgaris TaxID=7454 RepID=A0A834J9C5_VESVU|nr:hypothetical protein HZH66_013379 [Vespula vulgaris]
MSRRSKNMILLNLLNNLDKKYSDFDEQELSETEDNIQRDDELFTTDLKVSDSNNEDKNIINKRQRQKRRRLLLSSKMRVIKMFDPTAYAKRHHERKITKLLAKSNFRTIRRSKRELPKFSKQWKDNDTLFKQTSTNPSKMLLLIPCHTLTSLIRDKNFGPNLPDYTRHGTSSQGITPLRLQAILKPFFKAY